MNRNEHRASRAHRSPGGRPAAAPVVVPRRLGFAAGGVVLALTVAAPAQGPASREARGPLDVRVAASDRCFWTAQLGVARSRLYVRPLNGAFDAGRVIERRVATISAAADIAYVFFQDNSLARYTPGDESPCLNLPGKQRPIHAAATSDTLYALVDASVAAALPPTAGGDAPRPRDALTLVAYDGGRWSVVSDVDSDVRASDAPRILAISSAVLLFARSRDRDEIRCHRWDSQRAAWADPERIPCDDPGAFWAVLVDGAPVVVAVWTDAADSPRLAAYRRFASEWRPLDLRLGDLPDGARPRSIVDAVGMGQRLALLVADPRDESYLVYAGWQGEALPPSEPLSRPMLSDARNWTPQVRVLVMVILIGVVASLFLFRRETIAQPALLPPGAELAFISQRVAAWLIDFAPFALAAASATGLDGWTGLSALARWAFQLDEARDRLPETSVLVWWGLSVCGFTLYCLIMELVVGRTVGKLLAGYRAISPGRARTTANAALIRNLCRLIELFPPFWILLFLAVLTRNRQRLGDIYAGTVAVRFRAAPEGRAGGGDARGDTPQSGPDDEDGSAGGL